MSNLIGCSSIQLVGGGDPYAGIDGSPSAPAGPPQFPNLFSRYPVRPPWKVAGVDYAVGIDQALYPGAGGRGTNSALLSWRAIIGNGSPAGGTSLTTNGTTAAGNNILNFASTTGAMIGVSISGTNIPAATKIIAKTSTTLTISNNVTGGGVASGATITIAGSTEFTWATNMFTINTAGITIDGVDFSTAGMGVVHVNANSVTVQNCYWLWPSLAFAQGAFIQFSSGGTNALLQKCVFDGQMDVFGFGSTGGNFTTCIDATSTSATVIYCNFTQYNQHLTEIGITGVTYTFKYNLSSAGGVGAGSHPNLLQFPSGANGPIVFQFNTSNETANPTHAIGPQFYGNGGGGANPWNCSYNSIVIGNIDAAGGGGANGPSANGTCTENWISTFTGNSGWFIADPTATNIYYANFDLVTGGLITAPDIPTITRAVKSGSTAILNGTSSIIGDPTFSGLTITAFDGATNLGTTTTASNGTWTFTTGALTSGSHSLTATATNGSPLETGVGGNGAVSPASAVVNVVI